MSVPRIWPGRALARALLLPALLSLGVFVSEAMQPVVLVLDLVVALVAAADLASLRGAGRFRVCRQCGTTCSLGQPQQVTLALENLTRRGRRLRLRDDVPAVFAADPAEFRVDVPGRSRVELEYRVVPGRRGTYAFERVDALVLSRLGALAAFDFVAGPDRDPRLPRRTADRPLHDAGPPRPAERTGPAGLASARDGQRVRAAPRIHRGRRPAAPGLARHRPRTQKVRLPPTSWTQKVRPPPTS